MSSLISLLITPLLFAQPAPEPEAPPSGTDAVEPAELAPDPSTEAQPAEEPGDSDQTEEEGDSGQTEEEEDWSNVDLPSPERSDAESSDTLIIDMDELGITGLEIPVFISEFQAQTEDEEAFASMLRPYLHGTLRDWTDLDLKDLEEAGLFGSGKQTYTPLVYLQSCPPEEYAGCAWVVGQRLEARYALTGDVRSMRDFYRVRFSVIDIEKGQEALSFSLDAYDDDLPPVVEGVAQILSAVVRGEIGVIADIRDEEADPEEAARQRNAQNALYARQLSELKGSLGELGSVEFSTAQKILPPSYSLEDMVSDMAREETKPWERVGMSPRQYMLYRNSGLPLTVWRQRANGRKGHLILRMTGGGQSGLYTTRYYGRYSLDASLTLEQLYAWQALDASFAGGVGGWLGWGVTPSLEIAVGAGGGGGAYEVEINFDNLRRNEDTGEYEISYAGDREGEVYAGTHVWYGARALMGLLPHRKARPVVGGELSWVQIRPAVIDLGSIVPTFDASGQYLLARALLGGEVSMGEIGNLSLLIPMSYYLSGYTGELYQPGDTDLLSETPLPPDVPRWGLGVEVGVSLKLLGKKSWDRIEEDYP